MHTNTDFKSQTARGIKSLYSMSMIKKIVIKASEDVMCDECLYKCDVTPGSCQLGTKQGRTIGMKDTCFLLHNVLKNVAMGCPNEHLIHNILSKKRNVLSLSTAFVFSKLNV